MDSVYQNNANEIFVPWSTFNNLKEEFIVLKNLILNMDTLQNKHRTEIAQRDATIAKLQTRICNLQTRTNTLENTTAVSNIVLEKLKVSIDDNEQYSRRTSLRLNGIAKDFNETNDDIVEKVEKEVKRLNLTIDDYDLDRAHRTGRSYVDKNGKRQQPILVKFTSWYARDQMFKSRKCSNFYMKADLTK